MSSIFRWINRLSSRVRTSIVLSLSCIGLASTVMSIVGVSLNDFTHRFWLSTVIIVTCFFLLSILIFIVIGIIFKNSVACRIKQTTVLIECGDIFKTEGWKVIWCDNHFDTRVDDVVISKKSLHGQLILNHGDAKEIKRIVKKEAEKIGLRPNSDGLYEFPLGTIIKYESSVDNETYLMLAMTRLDSHFEAHTNMAEFEHMLMRMWKEINRIYASNTISLPLLGTGISRFDDGPKEKESLLRCLLCTLNGSGISFNSEIKIVIYGDTKEYSLFELKNAFKSWN